jgi:hypothetical protein
MVRPVLQFVQKSTISRVTGPLLTKLVVVAVKLMLWKEFAVYTPVQQCTGNVGSKRQTGGAVLTTKPIN